MPAETSFIAAPAEPVVADPETVTDHDAGNPVIAPAPGSRRRPQPVPWQLSILDVSGHRWVTPDQRLLQALVMDKLALAQNIGKIGVESYQQVVTLTGYTGDPRPRGNAPGRIAGSVDGVKSVNNEDPRANRRLGLDASQHQNERAPRGALFHCDEPDSWSLMLRALTTCFMRSISRFTWAANSAASSGPARADLLELLAELRIRHRLLHRLGQPRDHLRRHLGRREDPYQASSVKPLMPGLPWS